MTEEASFFFGAEEEVDDVLFSLELALFPAAFGALGEFALFAVFTALAALAAFEVLLPLTEEIVGIYVAVGLAVLARRYRRADVSFIVAITRRRLLLLRRVIRTRRNLSP